MFKATYPEDFHSLSENFNIIKTPIVEDMLFEIQGVVGRPLLCKEKQVVARLRSEKKKQEWTEGGEPDVEALSAKQRESLARYWVKQGLYKHASIISFNQFAMDLLLFGASPNLVFQAQQASCGEIFLSQQAFSLAVAFLGQEMCPDTISFQPQVHESLIEFAESIARCGVMNGSLGLAALQSQRLQATDGVISSLLTKMCAAEQSYLDLSWASLVWCLEHGGSAIQARLDAVFSQSPVFDLSDHPIEGIQAYGLLGRDEVYRIYQHALKQFRFNAQKMLRHYKRVAA